MIYTLEKFYNELPNLHKRYQSMLDISIMDVRLNKSMPNSTTKKILVYASLGCIDSVVNMMVLFLLKELLNIEIDIIIQGSSDYKELQNGQTPSFYGLDSSEKIIWTWIRTPNVVKSFEENGPQHVIIVEKKKYRSGAYLQNTLDELTELISRS